jgi:hypothetical protein
LTGPCGRKLPLHSIPYNESAPLEQMRKASGVFLLLGSVEIALGCLAIVADDQPIFPLVTVLLGGMGIVALLVCVLRARDLKIYDVLSAALLFGYATGALNSLIRYWRLGELLLPDSALAQYWHTRTLCLIGMSCGMLHLVGRLDPKGFLFARTGLFELYRRRIALASTLMFLLMAALLATGRIAFMGVTSGDDTVRVSPIAAITLLLATPFGALAFAAAVTAPKDRRLYLLIVSLLLLLIQFGLGRRVLIFSSAAYAIVAMYVLPNFKLLTVRNLVVGAIAVGVLYAGTTAFYAMRIATWKLSAAGSHTSRYDILRLIPEAVKVYGEEREGAVDSAVEKNLLDRTFVLEYLSEIARAEAELPPLYGQDALRGIVFATPGALYPGKYRNPLFESEEDLVNPHFGIPDQDRPNSIFTAGVADFGTAGLFLYPMIVCLAWSLLLRLVNFTAPAVVSFLFAIGACEHLLSVELDVSYYFVTPRTLLIAAALTWLVFFRRPDRPSRVAASGSYSRAG